MFSKINNDGNNSINNTGANAQITVYNAPRSGLNRSYLGEFCERFAELEDSTMKYDISIPSAIDKKIEHNKIVLFKAIFQDCDFYIDDVEEILQTIPKRERVVKQVHYEYIKHKNDMEVIDNDKICSLVTESLLNTIASGGGDSNLYEEDAKFAIYSLMYYVFTKCKLLDPVPMKEGK